LLERNHVKIIAEARIYLGLYSFFFLVSLFSASSWLLWFWIVPVLLGQPFLRLYLMAEHSGCDLSENMLENSRTTYASPIINFLAWNMPYHAEHHYLASVPFHALPALHAYTGKQVKFKGDGYWDVLRGVFKKLNGETA
jgi:fatty acid desaturase